MLCPPPDKTVCRIQGIYSLPVYPANCFYGTHLTSAVSGRRLSDATITPITSLRSVIGATYISATFGRGCGIIYVVGSGEGDGEVGAGGVLAVDDGDEIVDDVGV